MNSENFVRGSNQRPGESECNRSKNNIGERKKRPDIILDNILQPLRSKKGEVEFALRPLCLAIAETKEEITKLKNEIAKNTCEVFQVALELLKVPAELW